MTIFDIFKIGIGPSSSHTSGPMIASTKFLQYLEAHFFIDKLDSVEVELYGALALTGIGHSTDRAVSLGLLGFLPETVDPDKVEALLLNLNKNSKCNYKGKTFSFCPKKNIRYYKNKELPIHPNGICFIAKNKQSQILIQKNYYSIGGGFVIDDNSCVLEDELLIKHPFSSGKDLLEICLKEGLSISDLVLENELEELTMPEIDKKLKHIWKIMDESIERGLSSHGELPGALHLKRRASSMYNNIKIKKHNKGQLQALSYIQAYALAVSEENANGGRIVTAPTNGAAGIIPAIIKYYLNYIDGANIEGVKKILLTSGVIGLLYKKNASISGAEVGCQGEVGVASSMAAAGLTEVLGGDIYQVENAAEIAMEHALGLTCDPVGGYVQIPCIERNAMGAIKALAATQMALLGDGGHMITLDKVIKTMLQTGIDMQTKYKETSLGGLAVNIPEC